MARPHRKFNPKETKEFEEEVLQIDRVTRVVAGGRRLRFRATVVIGNRKKKVGIATGKANEVIIAIEKAIAKAKKNLITVPIENDTIPHEVEIKFKAAKLILIPARPGTGIIAGGSLRKIVELAGIKNILSKCLGTKNKLANAQAAIRALQKLQPIATKTPPPQEKAEPALKKVEPEPALKKVEPENVRSATTNESTNGSQLATAIPPTFIS